MRTTRTTTAAAAAAVVLFGAAGTAAAATAGSTGTPAPTSAAKVPTGDGAHALCKRVPRVDARIDRVLRRLGGPATVRGSVARLQKRVDNAKAKGDTAVATYLNDRLAFRKSLVPMLNRRSTDLDAVRAWCASRHESTAATPGTAK